MRIYAVADIHGRAERLRTIGETLNTVNADVLVVAGDITNYTEADRVFSYLNGMPVPVLAVRGNTDLRRTEKLFSKYSNLTSLHLREVAVDGVPIVGIGGTVPVPFSTRLCLREQGVIDEITSRLSRDSVLVVHPPPRGILDEVLGVFHAGCRRIRDVVLTCRPRLLICGHIHERAGIAELGETLVVNCNVGRGGAGAVIDITPGARPKADLLG
ncbi:MAG: metallophosphoesterase family protein [Deltaproteobacteria bacterium]|nr:metallophosphoesterase family protein [Deltaproteobacteria bacterium]